MYVYRNLAKFQTFAVLSKYEKNDPNNSFILHFILLQDDQHPFSNYCEFVNIYQTTVIYRNNKLTIIKLVYTFHENICNYYSMYWVFFGIYFN